MLINFRQVFFLINRETGLIGLKSLNMTDFVEYDHKAHFLRDQEISKFPVFQSRQSL